MAFWATITSTTNLELDFGGAPTTGLYDVAWQILEFNSDDVEIQSALIALTSLQGSKTATRSPSMDPLKTFISNSGFNMAEGGLPARNRARLKQTSSTLVDAARSTDGSTIAVNVRFDAVEFQDSATVETGLISLVDTDATEAATFTEIGADSFVWNADWRGNQYPSANTANNQDDNTISVVLSDPPDDVVATRAQSDQDMEIAYFVLDLTAVSGGQPMMRRWGGVPGMKPGRSGAGFGRSW